MQEIDSKKKDEPKQKFGLWSQRAFVTFMLFLGMANAYVMRTNMSVAIVAMVNHTAIMKADNAKATKRSRVSPDGDFVWDYQLQGFILASFFYGYVITQIPFGFLVKNYGAKHFLGWGMLLNSVAAFLVPAAARMGGPYALCVVRFIQGLGEGPIVPCSHSLLAHWIPPNERSRCGAVVYAGAQFGTIISMPLSGVLAVYGFDGGWPSIFYIFGTVSTLWSVLFIILIYDDPEKHPSMSDTERAYIVNTIWTSNEQRDLKTPIMDIAKSVSFWAILCAHCGQNYGYETLMTELPTYMRMVLHVSLNENGLLSAIPYAGMWITAMFLSIIADKMISSWNVSIAMTRKIMNSLGQYGPALALLIVSFTGHSTTLTVAMFTIGMALNGAIYCGFKINHLDLSPIFAGLLISITNCVANIFGLTAPLVAGTIIQMDPTEENWHIVFFISAAIYTYTATFYNIFASGKRQW